MANETREIGHAVAAYGEQLVEDSWDLQFPRGSQIFAKMAREDAQVMSVLKAITLPIRRATWRIAPNGAPDEIVEAVAEDLRLPVLGADSDNPSRSGRVSWDEHLQMALLSLVFGHMFFEQVYRVGDDGREHLHKLAPRYPLTIRKINVDDDGGLASIEQSARPGARGRRDGRVEIPVDRLVAYVHDPRDSSWLGTSVLRPAYKHWYLRDKLLKLEVTTLDRNGMGVPVYTASPYAVSPDADIANGQAIAEALRSGESSGAAIPDGAKLDIKGTSGQLVSPRSAIEYHDSMIARGVLAHFLNLEGKGGSYALAETQSDIFVQSLQTIAEWIAATATQHIVEDLVRVAFPEYEGTTPQVMFDPIASKKDLTSEALAALINCGAIIPDKDLEEEVRRRYSLPGKRPIEEALEEKKDRLEMEKQAGVSLSADSDQGGQSR